MEQSPHGLYSGSCAYLFEVGRLINQPVELANEFKTAFAEGTIEEKRLFLRGFLKSIEFALKKRARHTMFILLPRMEE